MTSKLDFVAVPSQHSERSGTFYIETLGLRPDDHSRSRPGRARSASPSRDTPPTA